MNWIHLTQDRDKRRVLVNKVSFKRRTLLSGFSQESGVGIIINWAINTLSNKCTK